MIKKCQHCKQDKPINEFFTQPVDSKASAVGTSAYCKQCHAEGKIKHGYGWYGERYQSPDWQASLVA